MIKHLIIFLSALFIVPLCLNAEKDAQKLVSELLELTSSPVAQTKSVTIPEIKSLTDLIEIISCGLSCYLIKV